MRRQNLRIDWPALFTGLKLAHNTLVLLSGGLFALRGLADLRGASRGMARAVRLTSYGIDTPLLLAGAGLWWLLGLHHPLGVFRQLAAA